MAPDRRVARTTKTLLDHWQFILVLLGGAAACFQFYYRMTDIARAQETWQANSEQRRDRSRDTQESDHIKLAVQANDIEWLKELRREDATRNHSKP